MAIGSSAEDYKDTMVKLCPTGPAWPTEDESNWVTLLDALAQEYARTDGASVQLAQESFPDTTEVLLPNWERTLGLPDVFSDPNASIDERRNTVIAKMQARGGQSADYLSGIIDTLGYENTIEEIIPFMADVGQTGEYLFGEEWRYHFIVRVQGVVADKPLFEARFRSLQPAHTVSIFIYEE